MIMVSMRLNSAQVSGSEMLVHNGLQVLFMPLYFGMAISILQELSHSQEYLMDTIPEIQMFSLFMDLVQLLLNGEDYA